MEVNLIWGGGAARVRGYRTASNYYAHTKNNQIPRNFIFSIASRAVFCFIRG